MNFRFDPVLGKSLEWKIKEKNSACCRLDHFLCGLADTEAKRANDDGAGKEKAKQCRLSSSIQVPELLTVC